MGSKSKSGGSQSAGEDNNESGVAVAEPPATPAPERKKRERVGLIDKLRITRERREERNRKAEAKERAIEIQIARSKEVQAWNDLSAVGERYLSRAAEEADVESMIGNWLEALRVARSAISALEDSAMKQDADQAA